MVSFELTFFFFIPVHDCAYVFQLGDILLYMNA